LNQRTAALLLATWFGCGRSPIAPGTVGSLGATAVAWVAVGPLGLPMWSMAVAAAALFFPSVWAAREAEIEAGEHDPSWVVVDEVVGQWLALAAARPDQLVDWFLAVVLFRFFDVVKPWPVRRLERLPHGYGVTADDAAAGLCAMIVLAVLREFVLS